MAGRRCKPGKPAPAARRQADDQLHVLDFAEWARGLLNNTTNDWSDEERAVLDSQVKSLANVESSATTLPPDPTAPTIVRDSKTLAKVAVFLKEAPEIVIDIETSELDPLVGEVVGVGLSMANANYYIPTGHRFQGNERLRPDQLPVDVVAKGLRLDQLPLVAHNAKYEFRWLRRHAGVSCNFRWDVMLAARLQASHLSADLKDLAARELDVPDWSLGKDEIKIVQFLPIERVALLRQRLPIHPGPVPEATGMPGVNKFLLHEVEMKLIPVVSDLEDAGYKVSRTHFERLRERLEPEMEKVLKAIRGEAGKDFNPGSPKQLRELLYERLKIKFKRRRKLACRPPTTSSSSVPAAVTR